MPEYKTIFLQRKMQIKRELACEKAFSSLYLLLKFVRLSAAMPFDSKSFVYFSSSITCIKSGI